MSKAHLIIMYSGKTHWVNWELRKIIDADRVPNLILMIPDVKGLRSSVLTNDIAHRVKLVEDVFQDTRWYAALTGIRDFKNLRAIYSTPMVQ